MTSEGDIDVFSEFINHSKENSTKIEILEKENAEKNTKILQLEKELAEFKESVINEKNMAAERTMKVIISLGHNVAQLESEKKKLLSDKYATDIKISQLESDKAMQKTEIALMKTDIIHKSEIAKIRAEYDNDIANIRADCAIEIAKHKTVADKFRNFLRQCSIDIGERSKTPDKEVCKNIDAFEGLAHSSFS